MAVSAILSLAQMGKDLFEQVASGKMKAKDAIAAHEAAVLAADVEMSKGQIGVAKIDAQSDRLIQWIWRPVGCICFLVASMVWPFGTILDTLTLIELTADQLENLFWVSATFLPYSAGTMGLREYGKMQRAKRMTEGAG